MLRTGSSEMSKTNTPPPAESLQCGEEDPGGWRDWSCGQREERSGR